MSWLDRFFTGKNYGTIQINGVALPPEAILNFIGVTGADDPTNQRTTLTIAGGGGGGSPAGDDNSLQYKVDASTFGGSTEFRVNADGDLDIGDPMGTYPIAGKFRLPYNGGTVVPIVKTIDSTTAERVLWSIGSGDQQNFGSTAIEMHMNGYLFAGDFPSSASTFNHAFLSFYAEGAGLYHLELRNNGAVWIEAALRKHLVEANDNYALSVGLDYHVAMTVSGKTVTMPSSGLVDGQEYVISNVSGGNITVDGNGKNIYVAGGNVATQTLADGEVGVYEYNSGVLSSSPVWVRIA